MTDVSKEYGTALFELAAEKNLKKEYLDSLKAVSAAMLENPDYEEFLASPAIPFSERVASLEEVFSGKISEDALTLLCLMCEKGRISGFREAFAEYEALFRESERIMSAVVTSAAPLSDKEKERLTKKLEAAYSCKVSAEYFVEPSLIGALRVELDGKVMDGSLRRRLLDIKEVMNG